MSPSIGSPPFFFFSFLTKRRLRNFTHQQAPLIPAMRGAARPNQNTNRRRMKRNGLQSQRSESIDCLPLSVSPPPLVFLPVSLLLLPPNFSENRRNHRQFAGRLAAGLSPAADRASASVRKCVSVKRWRTHILLFICICVFICMCACMCVCVFK